MSGSDGQPMGQPGAGQDDALLPRDAAAVDALVESGWKADLLGPRAPEGAGRIAALLEGLDRGPVRADSALIDAVLVRVGSLRRSEQAVRSVAAGVPSLHPDDAAATDALFAAGYEVAQVPERLRPRARRQAELLATLEQGQVGATGDLIARTLAIVDGHVGRQSDRMKLDAEASPLRTRRLQFADVLSVAAMLLIGTAVLWPMLSGAIEYNRKLACQSNMQAAGLGFGQYIKDYREVLPMASASPAGNPWWEVGRSPERSNSANQYTLVRSGYSKMGDLACAGHADACRDDPKPGAMDWESFPQVSYSYRMMFGRSRTTLTPTPDSLLLSDRAPIQIVQADGRRQLTIAPFGNSFNHSGKGQNLLFGDGSVVWLSSPVLSSGDNVWLPRTLESILSQKAQPVSAERIQGNEAPASDEDAFVGP